MQIESHFFLVRPQHQWKGPRRGTGGGTGGATTLVPGCASASAGGLGRVPRSCPPRLCSAGRPGFQCCSRLNLHPPALWNAVHSSGTGDGGQGPSVLVLLAGGKGQSWGAEGPDLLTLGAALGAGPAGARVARPVSALTSVCLPPIRALVSGCRVPQSRAQSLNCTYKDLFPDRVPLTGSR